MRRIALYAGSFDPVTNGHLDIVRQAARLADRLVLAIGVHPGKTPVFTPQERMEMLDPGGRMRPPLPQSPQAARLLTMAQVTMTGGG